MHARGMLLLLVCSMHVAWLELQTHRSPSSMLGPFSAAGRHILLQTTHHYLLTVSGGFDTIADGPDGVSELRAGPPPSVNLGQKIKRISWLGCVGTVAAAAAATVI